jgi:uncharacterized protein YutE (UPF0331/DUF86 family)
VPGVHRHGQPHDQAAAPWLPEGEQGQLRHLQRAGVLDRPAAAAMMAMVGFRNVAVHEYQELDLQKVRHIIEHRLDDLLAFSKAMLHADPSG